MSHWTGRITIVGSGAQTLVMSGCSFTPTWAHVRVNGVNGRTQLSEGEYDGTRQNFSYVFQDTTGGKSDGSNTKIISLFDRVSGTISEVLGANCTGFGTSGADATLLLNVTKFTASTTVAITVGD